MHSANDAIVKSLEAALEQARSELRDSQREAEDLRTHMDILVRERDAERQAAKKAEEALETLRTQMEAQIAASAPANRQQSPM